MEVSFSKSFKMSFQSRIKNNPVENLFWEKLEIFINDPFDIRLRTHRLSGKLKKMWSFTITYDCRVVFYFSGSRPKKAIFVDVGDHDEVY